MHIASILKQAGSVRIGPPASGNGEAGGSTSKSLACTIDHQTEDNWCWAAVSSSIARFYDSTCGWTQCTVAGKAFDCKTCCSAPAPCNKSWFLDKALAIVDCFNSMSASQMSFDDIRTQINAGEPVGVRVGWAAGGGHFLAITGYVSAIATDNVVVGDPWYGKTTINITALRDHYQGSGTWTHSYKTVSSAAGGGNAPPDHDPADHKHLTGGGSWD